MELREQERKLKQAEEAARIEAEREMRKKKRAGLLGSPPIKTG